MCFFDAHQFTCGHCKWGHFRQHCDTEYRTGETCGMKLVMQTVPTGGKCKLCEKIETKVRRRAAEMDRIGRWEREGHKFGASIEKSDEMIRGLDAEISELNRERSRRLIAYEKSTLDSEEKSNAMETTYQESLVDSVESDISWDEKWDDEGDGSDKVDVALEERRLGYKNRPLWNPVPSDSGYRSGHGTNTESVCSSNSIGSSLGFPRNLSQDFIAYFGNMLIERSGARHWARFTFAHYSLVDVEKWVIVLLKKYISTMMQETSASVDFDPSMGLGGGQAPGPSQEMFAGAAKIIRRYKAQIARYFCESLNPVPDNAGSLSVLLPRLGQQLSLRERLDLSTRRALPNRDLTEVAFHDQMDDEITCNDDTEEIFVHVEHIRERLVSSDAFYRLALDVRRCLYLNDWSEMRSIKTVMMEDRLIRPNSAAYGLELAVHWSPREFMRSQYGERVPHIGSVIVITGSVLYAQATTCAEYVITTWPNSGPFFLRLLDEISKQAVSAPGPLPEDPILISSDHGLSVRASLHESNIKITAETTVEISLIEMAQQFAWLGSALRASPASEQSTYAKPLFLRRGPRAFEIMFKHLPIHDTETACWLPLFCGAVIAIGFPIPERADEIGLELPLELLAGIAGVRHAVEYENGVVMKGYSHMFVPIEKNADRVQWHAIFSQDSEKRLSYHDGLSRCTSRATLQEVSLHDIKILRAFVGWCSVAKTRLGSDSANYENIDYSKADEADSGLKCTGGSFGFQQFGMAALDFQFGMKDGKCHFQRGGPFQKIVQAAESTPIVLYDTGEKRAWLVPASEVMLHMIQHRHRLNPFEVDEKPIRLDTNLPAGASARSVLLKNKSQQLLDEDEYTFKDDISNIWSILEYLLDQNVTRDRSVPGASIKGTLREALYGFEFKAVVLERSPFKLKKTKISKSNGGWPQLVTDVNALVLFADGFEDIIVPTEDSHMGLCQKWQRVPKELDYLATSTKMLQQLFDEAGSRLDRRFLTSRSKLQWHQGKSTLFDSCKDSARCECDRLQQLFPKSAMGSIVSPRYIADEGAVIFGRPDLGLTTTLRVEAPDIPSIYSQPNGPLTPLIIHNETDDLDFYNLAHSSTSGSDKTAQSNPESLWSHSSATTHNVPMELHGQEPNAESPSHLSESLHTQQQREQSRIRASIDRSAEIVRGLESEIFELSCERTRQLQQIGK